MTPQQRKELRTALTEELEKTKREVALYEERTKPIAPDNAIGRLSRMEAIGAKSIDESVLRNLRAKRAELERALTLIDDEEYGLCIDCDEPIPFKRLQIFPHALRCVQCKNIHDKE